MLLLPIMIFRGPVPQGVFIIFMIPNCETKIKRYSDSVLIIDVNHGTLNMEGGQPMQLGWFIRKRRTELALSVTQLAEKAGMSQSYLSQLEIGDRGNPSLESLKALAEALSVEAEQLEALVEVNRGGVRRLRVAIKDANKAVVRLPKLISDVEKFIRSGESSSAATDRDSWEMDDALCDSARRRTPTRADTERLLKLVAELRAVNQDLPPALDKLAATFDSPRYPEQVENLIRRVDDLGDNGFNFLVQMVEGIEKLVGVGSSSEGQ